ncbi:hypothetical protein SCHPADRAFT_789022, partial [Schizopora paradoxa]
KLYMACIDPHLTYGAELILDTSNVQLEPLQAVQHKYLRHILGLNPCSILAPLFTETGVVPLQLRRAELTIRYLKYLVSLPQHHYAKAAFDEARALALDGHWHPSWYGDLSLVLAKL